MAEGVRPSSISTMTKKRGDAENPQSGPGGGSDRRPGHYCWACGLEDCRDPEHEPFWIDQTVRIQELEDELRHLKAGVPRGKSEETSLSDDE